MKNMNKLKFEDVYLFIKNKGYTCLSKEYISSKSKLELTCPNGHNIFINFNSFKNGVRCSKCTGNKRLTLDNIIEHASKEGYIILSKEYNGSKNKIEFKCPKGHEFSIRYTNFRHSNHRCPICSNNYHSIETVSQFVEKEGYKCISKKYVNFHSKLEFVCPNGHIFSMSFGNFKTQGRRCSECLGRKKHYFTLEEVKQISIKKGYTCISEKYINIFQKLDFICSENHKFKMNFNDFKRKCRYSKCMSCKKLTIEEIKKFVNNENYLCINDNYINIKNKLDFICPKNHSFKMNFDSFKRGNRCSICSKSKTERTIRYLLEIMTGKLLPSINHKLIRNPKTNMPLQLDGYNGEICFAFEYQGIQHYQNVNYFKSNRTNLILLQERDEVKKKKCEELGIKLLIIPTIPYKLEPKDLKKFIIEHLNLFEIKIINKMPDFYKSMRYIISN